MSTHKKWRLGALGHTEIVIHPQALFTVAIICALYYPYILTTLPVTSALITAVLTALGLLGSILFHEIAHVLVARRFAVHAPRIELTILGGHAQFSTPFTTPWHSATTSLAGPAANLLLAGLLSMVLTVVPPTGVPAHTLDILIYLNLLLALFNAIPGLPLDGGHALAALMWAFSGKHSTGTRIAAYAGRALAVITLFAVTAVPFLRGDYPNYVVIVWGIILAAVLWSGTAQSLRYAAYLARIEKINVHDIARPAIVLPAHASVQELHRDSVHLPHAVVLLTAPNGDITGWVDRSVLNSVPPTHREHLTAQSIAITLLPGSHLRAPAHTTVIAATLFDPDGSRPLVVLSEATHPTRVVVASDLAALLAR